MQIITIPQTKQFVRLAGVKKRRPVYIHGPSGCGKSEAVEQLCEEMGGTLVDIRLSQYEAIDLRGIPDIQAGTTVWNVPATLPFKGNAKFDNDLTDHSKPIFLFFDEANQGDESVLSVMYQITQNRRCGEHELMDNVHIILAGNRAKDKGYTKKFPAPLNNRLKHCEVVPDIKSWTKWASASGVISPIIIGFLNFRDELLYNFDSDKPVECFATPRAWHNANEDFLDDEMSDDIKAAAMAGTVGEGPAVELMGFAAIMDTLRPIEEIIAEPETTPVPTQLDHQWAMATHVASHMTKDTTDQLHKYLDRMEPEMVVMAWTMAIQKNEEVTDTNAFLFSYASKYRGLFQS